MKKYLPDQVSNRGAFHQQPCALPTELQKLSQEGGKFSYIAADLGPVLVDTCLVRNFLVSLAS